MLGKLMMQVKMLGSLVHQRGRCPSSISLRSSKSNCHRIASTCRAAKQDIGSKSTLSQDATQHKQLGLENLTRRQSILLVCSSKQCDK
jgi:hypothetical protein